MEIFITYNDKFEIQLIHNMPFDEINGLGMSRDQLLKEGALVDSIPEVEVSNNKLAIYKYNEDNNTVYCEFIDRPLTIEELNSNKISILEKENIKLKESQSEQDTMIQSTQDAVDFILLGDMPMKLKNINLGGKSMANYIALRIIQKGEVSEKAGQDYYVTFLTHPSYARFKDEVDVILKASGNENLIVDLTSL